MIKTVEIRNFQSHKKTELQFHPGVNVIVGSSDSGKSAIIRALRWVLTGVPRGDFFCSHWGGATEVKVELNEGVVTRLKDGNKNVYRLNDVEYKAFGTEVPEEIVQLVNIDSEVNFQKQLDLPYLISDTPGAVALHFNRIANLEAIELGIKTAQSRIRKVENSLEIQEEKVKQLQEQLVGFEYLEQVEERVVELERMEQKLKVLIEESKVLQRLMVELEQVELEIQKFPDISIVESEVASLISDWDVLQKDKQYQNSLIHHISEIRRIDTYLEKYKIDDGVFEKVEQLFDMYNQLKDLKELYDDLSKSVFSLKSIGSEIQTQEKELSKIEQLFHKEMPEVCPLCGK